MKSIISVAVVVILFLISSQSINAAVKLPAIESSNMVLQRNTTVVLWGWADAKEKITITASWLDKPLNIEANREGNWRIEIKTTNSKRAQSIEFKSHTSDIVLENVLFGEVWLCSGQSNMEMPVKGFKGMPTFSSLSTIAKSNNPNLRLFTVNKFASKAPLHDVEKYIPWQQATPGSVADFSAVGYFFGQQLQEILDVPVGLIFTSWGASTAQAWMSKKVLNEYQKVNLDDVDIAHTQIPQQIPTVLFNAMINPLIPFTIKGAIWYQGEANRSEPDKYKKLFPAMVKDWRDRWGIGDFPFYYVQIAPFPYHNSKVFQNFSNSAFIREAQLQCLDLIPNSGIAITMDIGDEYCIHPPKKKEVADRLLFNALNQTYGYKTVGYASPVYEANEVKDGGIVLTFKNDNSGMYAYGQLQGFEIAGEDKVFYPANAKIIQGTKVFVKSESVANPIAVRYAWRNWIVGTLFNGDLLPVSSFRTDDWDDATKSDK